MSTKDYTPVQISKKTTKAVKLLALLEGITVKEYVNRTLENEVRKNSSKLDESTKDTFDLFEMSNLHPEDTGLSKIIWVSAEEVGHAPRIKVSVSGKSPKKDRKNSISFSINDPIEVVAGDSSKLSSKITKTIISFIELNRQVLLDYWDEKISTRQMLDSIKKVK